MTQRHRLNRGGARATNSALHIIAMRLDPQDPRIRLKAQRARTLQTGSPPMSETLHCSGSVLYPAEA